MYRREHNAEIRQLFDEAAYSAINQGLESWAEATSEEHEALTMDLMAADVDLFDEAVGDMDSDDLAAIVGCLRSGDGIMLRAVLRERLTDHYLTWTVEQVDDAMTRELAERGVETAEQEHERMLSAKMDREIAASSNEGLKR